MCVRLWLSFLKWEVKYLKFIAVAFDSMHTFINLSFHEPELRL